MHRVQKFHGPDRQVLRDISLSFLPGAKIGVLGPNGAGKSTLLRIMAGLEETSSGDARLAPGATVGFLPQEPELDPAKDVRGNVEDGVAEKRDLLQRFEEISARFAEPMSDDEMTALLEEQGEVQDRIDRTDAWNLDRTLDTAMDALRCPPSDAEVATLSGGERRRVALCRAPALVARPAAPRRADQPPRRRVRRLARAVPRRVRRDGARRHPRPLLPRQRRRLDPRARPRARHPVPGQLHVLARAEAGPAGRRGEAGVGAPSDARPGARVGADGAPRPPREVEGQGRVLRAASRRRGERQARPGRDPHPRRAAARRRRGRGPRGQQGLRRQAALRRPVVLAAARRHRRRYRRERRRQDHALSHDRRRGVG